MIEFTQPWRRRRCIVCGSDGPELKEGTTHGFDFWYHEEVCQYVIDRCADFAKQLWFYDLDHRLSSLDAPAGFPPPVIPTTGLFLGAGLSVPAGIPGYQQFLRRVSDVTGEIATPDMLAFSAINGSAVYRKAMSIFFESEANARATYAHLATVEQILDGHFQWVATTNWDSILENLFDTVLEMTNIRNGSPLSRWQRDPQLYGLGRLLPLQPVLTDADLEHTDHPLPFYKIHGNPFLHVCPRCPPPRRYHRISAFVTGKLVCPTHNVPLSNFVVFAGGAWDRAHARVFEHLKVGFAAVRQILVLGYSGNDVYLHDQLLLPHREKLWIVSPDSNSPTMRLAPEHQRIVATATAFFRVLYVMFLRYNPPHNPNLPRLMLSELVRAEMVDLTDEWPVTSFYHPHVFRDGPRGNGPPQPDS